MSQKEIINLLKKNKKGMIIDEIMKKVKTQRSPTARALRKMWIKGEVKKEIIRGEKNHQLLKYKI